MEENQQKQIYYSSTGKRENNKNKKKDNLGWYAFLFFVFIVAYGLFSFVIFK